MLGIFFEADHARAVADALRSQGWEAAIEREPYAGEDDDEGHPWTVRTDAPEMVLDILVDEFDGWLDHEVELPAPSTPLDLPTGPRRIKRQGTQPGS